MATIKGNLKAANGDIVYPHSSADVIAMKDAENNDSTVQAEIVANRTAISALTGLTTLKLHTDKLGSNSFTLPANPTAGDAYFVGVAGTYDSKVGEVGDLFVYANSTDGWMVLQVNLTNAVIGPSAGAVDENLAIFDGTTGKLVKDSSITKASVNTAVSVGSTLNSNATILANFSVDGSSDITYNGTKLTKVGIPVVANGGSAPTELLSGGLYFEQDAVETPGSGS